MSIEPLEQLAATPLPDLSACSEDGEGAAPHLDSAIYLRKWLLDLRLHLDANRLKRHQMLKAAILAHVSEAFGEALEAMAEDAAEGLYERLMKEGKAE